MVDRRTRVADLSPATESAYARLVREGAIVPPKVRFDSAAFAPVERRPGEPTASDVLRGMRDEQRY